MKKNSKLRIINYAFVCMIGLTHMVSSCSESDDQSSDKEQIEDGLTEAKQMNAIQNVLRCLADVDTLKSDFYKQTYKPTYGKVLDESNPYVRSFKADDKESALEEFILMVGNKSMLTATTDGYTIDLKLPKSLSKNAGNESFGTLTYHSGDASTCTAYVDVNIPNMPNLQRIDFVSSQLWGDNSSPVMTAYELGQVVSNSGLLGKGLWLCVQENTGEGDGLLVHVNEGYDSNNAHILYKEDSGYSWASYFYARPQDYRPYFQFLNKNQKVIKKIRQFLEDNGKGSEMSGIVPKRFLENGNVYDGDRPAWVINDTYESEYCSGAATWWKCCKHYYLKEKNEYGSGQYEEWWYHRPGDWDDQQNKYYFYTIGVIRFQKKPIVGMSLLYDPS